MSERTGPFPDVHAGARRAQGRPMRAPGRARLPVPGRVARRAVQGDRCRPAAGVALIEALVAMLVVAISLLALAAAYITLARGAEVGRHRGEATRMAQERIEQLRSFTSIDGSVAAGTSWNALASGSDTLAGTASFDRRWTLGGAVGDPLRPVQVEVRWTDRQGEQHSLNLATVLSRTDPGDVGALGVPLPENTALKRPKNRNLDIPIPASDLGNGESAFRLPNTSYAVLFSNDTGWVIKTCSLSGSGGTITLADLSDCSTTTAYVGAGYLSLDGSASFPTGLAVNSAGVQGASNVTCSVTTATGSTSDVTLPAFRYYICVVQVPSAGATWSGRLALAAPVLQTGSTQLLVCRFEYPASPGLTPNQRNVQPYTDVGESLTSQNLVLSSGSSCPTVGGLATVQHQRCRNDNPNRASDCPAS